MAIARVGCLIAILITETLPCNDYNIKSKTQEHYDDEIATDIATKYASFMVAQAKSIHIQSDKLLDAKLDKLMDLNNRPSAQKFMGSSDAEGMIEHIKSGVVFSMTFLRSKDVEKKTGVIEVVIVYYPFADDEETIYPQCVDGFLLEVKLPYKGKKKGIGNFINSETAANYLHQ